MSMRRATGDKGVKGYPHTHWVHVTNATYTPAPWGAASWLCLLCVSQLQQLLSIIKLVRPITIREYPGKNCTHTPFRVVGDSETHPYREENSTRTTGLINRLLGITDCNILSRARGWGLQ